MQFLLLILLSTVAAAQTGSPSALALKKSDPVLVTAVLDGDTIAVATFGRVRLLGIDAPEIGRGFDTAAPFGREARDRLTSLLWHRWVRLELEAPYVDVYSRRLAYVWREDGLFVNAVLVREGLARVTARAPLARLDELKRAEAEAQSFRRGMWGKSPEIPTAGYTSSSPKKRSASTPKKRSSKPPKQKTQ